MNPKLRSASIATACATAILLGLGTWQLKRLAWKEALLAEIDHAEAAAPVPLADPPGRFAKVVAHGSFRPGTALYGVELHDIPGQGSVLGAHLLQVLDRPGAAPVLVDRGWVKLKAPPPARTGPADVVGYARPPENQGFLSAEDDVAARHFYTLNPGIIGAGMGVDHLAPYTLISMGPQPGTAGGGAEPIPAEALPRPPNNHLQYAFTWFGLAASLLGVFGVWARGQRAG